jgi:C1A family cysteine protease
VCVGRNSWGRDWGLTGDFKLAADDLDVLLKNAGEAVVPVARS